MTVLTRAQECDFVMSLVNEGMSNSDIVKKLFEQHHIVRTRSAIAGIRFRADTKAGRARPPRKSRAKEPPARAPHVERAPVRLTPIESPPLLPIVKRPPVTVADDVVSLRLSLTDLPENGCRYPCGVNEESGFALFCGQEGRVIMSRLARTPYCEAHAKLMYQAKKGAA